MIITILKRDGRKEKFELSKIENAIYKAAVACGGTNNLLAHELALKVQTILDQNTAKNPIPKVEEIQDIVEKVLIENGHAKTAKAYILYRKQHERIRNANDTLIDYKETIDKYLKVNDWRVKAH